MVPSVAPRVPSRIPPCALCLCDDISQGALVWRKIRPMAKTDTFEVDCPCCHAKLTIDRELGVVLSHIPPPKPPSSVDLDDPARLLREQADAVEAKFRASVEAERTKEDVLARKFAEGLKKAKDAPVEKPLRDFDLD